MIRIHTAIVALLLCLATHTFAQDADSFSPASHSEVIGSWVLMGRLWTDFVAESHDSGFAWTFFPDGRVEVRAGASDPVHGLWSMEVRSRANILWPSSDRPIQYNVFRSATMLLLLRATGSRFSSSAVGEVLVFELIPPRASGEQREQPARIETTFADEPVLGVPDESAISETAARRERSTTEDLFAFNETTSDSGTVPQEVLEVLEPIGSEASLDLATRARIDEKSELVVGFQDRLNQIIGELNDTSSLPGDSRLDWVGPAVYGAIGELALPTLSENDFGGNVPATTRVIVVFDVNENGLVAPGSVFFRHSSGHGRVDQKIGDSVRLWRFEPSPGADVVTVICTLILERDTIR